MLELLGSMIVGNSTGKSIRDLSTNLVNHLPSGKQGLGSKKYQPWHCWGDQSDKPEIGTPQKAEKLFIWPFALQSMKGALGVSTLGDLANALWMAVGMIACQIFKSGVPRPNSFAHPNSTRGNESVVNIILELWDAKRKKTPHCKWALTAHSESCFEELL